MEKAIVGYNSGQLDRYIHEVAPLERKLKRNNGVNWAVCLGILLLITVAGVVVGFFVVPTILGMFAGLAGGSVVGALLITVYYFARSSMLLKTKEKTVRGLSACKDAYQEAYKIPEGALKCGILASDFLANEYFGPSLIYVRDDGSISIVAPDYASERNEIRYSSKSVIAYSLFSDSRVLVQSEEGYVVLSPEAKRIFVSTDLPLLRVDSNQLFELSNKTFRAFSRPKDAIQRYETAENSSWKAAEGVLSNFLGRGA